MNLHHALTHGGSGVAFIGGSYAILISTINPQDGGTHTSLAGLIVALGGLATALGAQVQPAIKMYLDERRESRIAANARHDLSNKLQASQIEITLLKIQHDELVKTIEENRRLIFLLANRHEPPTEAHPDPAQEYQDASEDTLHHDSP